MPKSIINTTTPTYNNINAVHAAGGGQRMDPVGYQGTSAHRQQRFSCPDQVSEPPASVSSYITLKPGSVPGGENYSFHLDPELEEHQALRSWLATHS